MSSFIDKLSTTTPIGLLPSYTTNWVYLEGVSSLFVSCLSDSDFSYSIEWSNDSINIIKTYTSSSKLAGSTTYIYLPVNSRYVRIVYNNFGNNTVLNINSAFFSEYINDKKYF